MSDEEEVGMTLRSIVLIIDLEGDRWEHSGSIRPDMRYGFPLVIDSPGEYQLDVTVEGDELVLNLVGIG